MSLNLDFTEKGPGEEMDAFNLDAEEKTPEPIEDQPPVKREYDLDAIKTLFASYDPRFESIKAVAVALEVKDDDTAATATEMIGQGSKLIKALDAKRKEIIKDPDAYVRGVNSIVRQVKQKVEGIVKMLKNQKLGPYHYKKEMDRRKEEKKAKDTAAAMQKEIDKAAEKAGVETVNMPDPVIPKKTEPIRTDVGTSSTRMVWDFEISEPEKVPDDYRVIDEKKIKRAIDAGIRDIPGVHIYERPQVSVRTN